MEDCVDIWDESMRQREGRQEFAISIESSDRERNSNASDRKNDILLQILETSMYVCKEKKRVLIGKNSQ